MSQCAPQLSVLIVSHDSGDVLPRCIKSLRQQRGLSIEIILVDNGSAEPPTEASGADLVLRNPHNPGFAVACNQAAARARAPWLLFLNPDCFPAPNDLPQLLRQAERFGPACRLGAIGVQLLGPDGRAQAASVRRDPTPARLLSAFRRGRSAIEGAQTALDVPGEPAGIEVEAISGALMLMPRQAFEAVGGFDEGYRLHFEDLDLCRRLRACGYSVLFAPTIRIVHLKGTSSRRRPLWVAWQKHRGWRRYFERFDAPALGRLARLGFRSLQWLALPLLLLRALGQVRPTGPLHRERQE